MSSQDLVHHYLLEPFVMKDVIQTSRSSRFSIIPLIVVDLQIPSKGPRVPFVMRIILHIEVGVPVRQHSRWNTHPVRLLLSESGGGTGEAYLFLGRVLDAARTFPSVHAIGFSVTF